MRQIFRTLLTSIFVLILFVLTISVFYLASEKKKITEQYNKDRELWTTKNNILRENLKKSEEEIANLKSELKKLYEELKKADDELNELRLGYENLKSENFSLNQKISDYEREKEHLLKKIVRLEQDLKIAQEEQKAKLSSEESWANLLKEKVNLQTRINEVEERIRNNRLLLSQLGTERNKLEQRLNEIQQDKINIEKSLGGKEVTNSRSPRDILKANLEKEEMDKKLINLTMERDDLEKRIVSLKQEIEKTEAEKQNLNSQIEHINSLLEEKLVQVNKIKEELENALKEAKRLALSGVSPVELPPVVIKNEGSQTAKEVPSVMNFNPPQTEQANILLYNEKYNFVILNIGRKDGVVEGMIFDLYDKQENIGQIKIKEVREKLSAGEILELKKDNKINTETTTAIYSP